MKEILLEVEIRPRWDWKYLNLTSTSSEIFCWNQTKMGLKALNTSSVYIKNVLCWNQTKMGLKDCNNEEGRWDRNKVEIRPRWDWKVIVSRLELHHVLGWNQTKMGLKVYIVKMNCSGHTNSWNQTKMGLKGYRVIIFSAGGERLKSDQDGIESES